MCYKNDPVFAGSFFIIAYLCHIFMSCQYEYCGPEL